MDIGINNTERRRDMPAVIAKIAVKLFAGRLRYSSPYASNSQMHPVSCVLMARVCRESAHIFTSLMPAWDILVAMNKAVAMAQHTPPKTIAYLNEP